MRSIVCDEGIMALETAKDEVSVASFGVASLLSRSHLAEPGPVVVHAAQALLLLGVGGVEGLAAPEPSGEVHPGLRPGERPRDGPQALDAALRVALGGPGADIEDAELELGRSLPEVRDEPVRS